MDVHIKFFEEHNHEKNNEKDIHISNELAKQILKVHFRVMASVHSLDLSFNQVYFLYVCA